MTDQRATNHALARYLLLPTIFLTVALTGGVRVDAATRAFVFLPPPLVTLVLATLLLLLFVRGRLLDLHDWFNTALPPRTLVAHALTLGTLCCASAQAFNAVLPEAGWPRWLFAFFFLWTLWQNQFSTFDARRLLRSLAALFGTAFALKHLLLAGLYAPEGNWLRRLAGTLVEGLTQGTVGQAESFAPATGYIAFGTLALYVGGLALLSFTAAEANAHEQRAQTIINDYQQLAPAERALVRARLLRAEAKQLAERDAHADAIEAELINEQETTAREVS